MIKRIIIVFLLMNVGIQAMQKAVNKENLTNGKIHKDSLIENGKIQVMIANQKKQTKTSQEEQLLLAACNALRQENMQKKLNGIHEEK